MGNHCPPVVGSAQACHNMLKGLGEAVSLMRMHAVNCWLMLSRSSLLLTHACGLVTGLAVQPSGLLLWGKPVCAAIAQMMGSMSLPCDFGICAAWLLTHAQRHVTVHHLLQVVVQTLCLQQCEVQLFVLNLS